MTGLSITAASLASLVAKATLVLSLALVLAWLARQGSARTLHMLWTTTFVLLLALPALSLLGPSWALPILPARDAGAELSALAEAAGEVSAAETPREMAGSPALSGPARKIEGSNAEPGSFNVDPSARQSRASTFSVPPSPAAIAFLIWALGSTAALISLAVGALRFRRLVRQASPLGDPGWVRQTDTTRRRLGVRAEVRLLSGEKVPTPMTGGLWKPVILLPSAAETWTPERRAVVLAHELVHVRRRDAFRQVVGRAVVAFYWFHPLSWLASRFATVASERSCDEEVLALGARPSEYARHLFSLASEVSAAGAVLALTMVKRSQLESRIMSILKQHRPRFSAIRTTVALAAMAGAGILAACANPVPRDPAAQLSPPVEMTVPGDLPAGNSAIRVSDPEPAPPVASVPDPAPPATPVSRPVPPVVPMPEAIDSQALECNPGNVAGVVRGEGEWTIQQRVDGMRLCMRTGGNVEMTDDGTAVQSMQADSWLVLESQAEKLHRLVITSGPDGLDHGWTIDGSFRPFDEEAREWRDLMLTVMAGHREALEVRGQEATLRGRIATHRGHVATLRGRIATRRGHVATLRGRIATHRGHVAILRGRMASERGHVAALQGEIGVYRGQIALSSFAARSAARPRTQEALADEISEWENRILEVEDEIESYGLDARLAEIEEDIEGYDLEDKVQAVRQAIEEYDLDGNVRDVEAQIEQYDVDGRVRDLELEIDEYDLDGKVRELEAQIEELDADRRADAIERSIQDEIAALRRLIG